jgi:sortase (surface protein transpeptidase)
MGFSLSRVPRKVQIFGWTLIWSGIFIFGYLGWQLVGTDVVNSRVQAEAKVQLEESLEQTRDDLPDVEEVPVPEGAPEGPPEVVEYHPEDQPEEDTGFAYLSVPALDLEAVLFEGVTPQTLSRSSPRVSTGSRCWTVMATISKSNTGTSSKSWAVMRACSV